MSDTERPRYTHIELRVEGPNGSFYEEVPILGYYEPDAEDAEEDLPNA